VGRKVSWQGGSHWAAVHEKRVADHALGWVEKLEE